jgi:hypothetical protein
LKNAANLVSMATTRASFLDYTTFVPILLAGTMVSVTIAQVDSYNNVVPQTFLFNTQIVSTLGGLALSIIINTTPATSQGLQNLTFAPTVVATFALLIGNGVTNILNSPLTFMVTPGEVDAL